MWVFLKHWTSVSSAFLAFGGHTTIQEDDGEDDDEQSVSIELAITKKIDFVAQIYPHKIRSNNNHKINTDHTNQKQQALVPKINFLSLLNKKKPLRI